MSSHHIFVSCRQCKVTDQVYTADVELENFDDADWEMERIEVLCRGCKTAQPEPDLFRDMGLTAGAVVIPGAGSFDFS